MFPAIKKTDAGWAALHRKQAIRSYSESLAKYNKQIDTLTGELEQHIKKYPFLLERTRGKKWINGEEYGCWNYPVETLENNRDKDIRKLARKNNKIIQTYHTLRGKLLEARIYQERLQNLLAGETNNVS